MLVFAACDTTYLPYASALELSGKQHGMDVWVHCSGLEAKTEASRCYHSNLRYLLLPDLLKRFEQVLVLDVDSLIRQPLWIEREWDMGLYFRPENKDPLMKTLAAGSYFTWRAWDFARELREEVQRRIEKNTLKWAIEQQLMWEIHDKCPLRYRVKDLKGFLDWEDGSPVWSPKGPRKKSKRFREACEELTKNGEP